MLHDSAYRIPIMNVDEFIAAHSSDWEALDVLARAEDLDMIKGISDFQNQQVGYEAALKSYAQVQKLSLFNFIS